MCVCSVCSVCIMNTNNTYNKHTTTVRVESPCVPTNSPLTALPHHYLECHEELAHRHQAQPNMGTWKPTPKESIHRYHHQSLNPLMTVLIPSMSGLIEMALHGVNIIRYLGNLMITVRQSIIAISIELLCK